MVLSSTARAFSGSKADPAHQTNLSITQQLSELQMKLHASEKHNLELQQKLVEVGKDAKQAHATMASLTALVGRKMMLFERSMLILRAAACYHGYASVDLYIQAMSKKSSFTSSDYVRKFEDESLFTRHISSFTKQVSADTGEPMPTKLSPDEAWLDECLLRLGDNWAVTMAGADPDAPAEPLVKEAGVQVHPSGISVDQETQTDTSGNSSSENTSRQATIVSSRNARGSSVGLFSLMGSLSRSKEGSQKNVIEETGGDDQDNSLKSAAARRQSIFSALRAMPSKQATSPRQRASVAIPRAPDVGGSEMPSPILEKVSAKLLRGRHSIGSMDGEGETTSKSAPLSPASAQPNLPSGNSSTDIDADQHDKKPLPPAAVPQASSPSPKRNSMAAMIRANFLQSDSGGGAREPKKDAPLGEIIRQQRIRRASQMIVPGDTS